MGMTMELLGMSTAGLPEMSTMSSQSSADGSTSLHETQGEVGTGSGETLCLTLTSGLIGVTGASTAPDNDETIMIIRKKDTMPYSATEQRAGKLYKWLARTKSETAFPTVICETQEAADAMQAVFGSCELSGMLKRLDLLEQILHEIPDGKE